MENALRSALAQTYPVDEIIVIDDGSNDGTGAALRDLFGDRLRYTWQAHAGVSAARNHGLRLARGTYITFLDSDDSWLPNKIQEQMTWMKNHPDYSMVLCDLIRHNKQDQVVSTFRRRDLLPVNGDIFKWVLQEPSLAPSSVLMHRRVLEEIGGFNEGLRTAEDLDYHLRIAARFRIGIVEQALVRTLVGNGGLSSLPQTYEDHLQVVQNAVDRCDQQISERDKRRALALANARCARGMILSGRTTLAWKYFREAWRLEPSLLQRFKLLRLATLLARREVAKYRTNRRA